MASRRTGTATPRRDIKVSYAGDRQALAVATVCRAVSTVLDGEEVGAATVAITFMSTARMRSLNRRTFGRDRATDVVAFPLAHDDELVGDVYVCPSIARRSARCSRISSHEELLRLVVHGILHVLGYDHPTGASRTRSRMWKLQEAYVASLVGGRV